MSIATHPFFEVPGSQLRWLILASAIYLCGLCAATAMAPYRGQSRVLLFAAVNLVLVVGLIVHQRRNRGWLHPTILFAAMHAFLTVIVRTPLIVLGPTKHPALPEANVEQLTAVLSSELAVSAIALLAYGLVSAAAASIAGGSSLGARQALPGIFTWAPAAIVVGIVLSSLLLARHGGVDDHLRSLELLGRHRANAPFGFAAAIAGLTPWLCLLWLAEAPELVRSVLYWTAAVASTLSSFLTTGSRSSLVVLGVGTVVVLAIRRHRWSWRTTSCIGLVTLISYSLFGEYRRDHAAATRRRARQEHKASTSSRSAPSLQAGRQAAPDGQHGTTASLLNSPVAAVGEIGRRVFERSATTPILARVGDDVPVARGRIWADGLLAATVPRALWQDKPATVGRQASAVFFGRRGGRPPTAIGEAYWNLHIPGVLLVYALWALGADLLSRSLVRSGFDSVYLVVLARFAITAGPTVKAAVEIALLTVVLWLLARLCRR